MVSMDAAMAEDRVMRLEALLQQVHIDNLPEPIQVGVSWGFTNYGSAADLENAIKDADSQMYRRKELRKQRKTRTADFINSLPGGGMAEFAP
jgi:hypothetical protein